MNREELKEIISAVVKKMEAGSPAAACGMFYSDCLFLDYLNPNSTTTRYAINEEDATTRYAINEEDATTLYGISEEG